MGGVLEEMSSWSASAWGVIIALALGVVNLLRPAVVWWDKWRRAGISVKLERYVFNGKEHYRLIVRNPGQATATNVRICVHLRRWSAEDSYPPLEPGAGVFLEKNIGSIRGGGEGHLPLDTLPAMAEPLASVYWRARWRDRRRKSQVDAAQSMRFDV